MLPVYCICMYTMAATKISQFVRRRSNSSATACSDPALGLILDRSRLLYILDKPRPVDPLLHIHRGVTDPHPVRINIPFGRCAVAPPLCVVYNVLLWNIPTCVCDSPCLRTLQLHLTPCSLQLAPRLSGRVRLPTVRERSVQPGRQRLHGRVLGHRRRERGKGGHTRHTPLFFFFVCPCLFTLHGQPNGQQDPY